MGTEPGSTRNDKGRTLPFSVLAKFETVLGAAPDNRGAPEGNRIIPRVFHHDGDTFFLLAKPEERLIVGPSLQLPLFLRNTFC